MSKNIQDYLGMGDDKQQQNFAFRVLEQQPPAHIPSFICAENKQMRDCQMDLHQSFLLYWVREDQLSSHLYCASPLRLLEATVALKWAQVSQPSSLVPTRPQDNTKG